MVPAVLCRADAAWDCSWCPVPSVSARGRTSLSDLVRQAAGVRLHSVLT